MVEQLKHCRRGACRRVCDLALLGVQAEIGNEKAASTERDFAPRWDDDLALGNIDSERHAAHRQLGLFGQHRRQSGNVDDAHAAEIQLDIDGFCGKLPACAQLGDVGRTEIDGELAAHYLAASHPLEHPGARLAGKEFRPEALQHIDRHRTDHSGYADFLRARRIDHAAGKLDRGGSCANHKTRDRHAAVLRRDAAGHLPFVDLHGGQPELLDAEHRRVGLEGEVPCRRHAMMAHGTELAAEGRLAVAPDQRGRSDLDDVLFLEIAHIDIAPVDAQRAVRVPGRRDLPRIQGRAWPRPTGTPLNLRARHWFRRSPPGREP